MVDFALISAVMAPLIIVAIIYGVILLNIWDPVFDYPNPRGDDVRFDYKQLKTDTPDPRISGLFCRNDMMPIICMTTLEEQNAAGRQDIDPFPC